MAARFSRCPGEDRDSAGVARCRISGLGRSGRALAPHHRLDEQIGLSTRPYSSLHIHDVGGRIGLPPQGYWGALTWPMSPPPNWKAILGRNTAAGLGNRAVPVVMPAFASNFVLLDLRLDFILG